jgi:hypothetical protein
MRVRPNRPIVKLIETASDRLFMIGCRSLAQRFTMKPPYRCEPGPSSTATPVSRAPVNSLRRADDFALVGADDRILLGNLLLATRIDPLATSRGQIGMSVVAESGPGRKVHRKEMHRICRNHFESVSAPPSPRAGDQYSRRGLPAIGLRSTPPTHR